MGDLCVGWTNAGAGEVVGGRLFVIDRGDGSIGDWFGEVVWGIGDGIGALHAGGFDMIVLVMWFSQVGECSLTERREKGSKSRTQGSELWFGSVLTVRLSFCRS